MLGMGCNHCLHPTCPHSMVTNAVGPCPESERETDPCQGRLVLDATSAPRWKLSCNECNIVTTFVDTIKRKRCHDDDAVAVFGIDAHTHIRCIDCR